jgi:16S rRNA C967 or C1407 C5-methylase (RsmB/RsmF family)
MNELIKDEWTQEEFLKNRAKLQKEGIKVVLIDTILNPIEKEEVVTYNPFELKKYPDGSVFVFYCDTGKETKERLEEFKKKFPNHYCISLKGGRGYWRKNMMVFDER